MGKDYYEILGIDRISDLNSMTTAFRELALKWHPAQSMHKIDPEPAKLHFSHICEAYDVLRNPDTRAFYDQFGEEGLKRSAGMFKLTDPTVLFKEQFGSDNPFEPRYAAMAERRDKVGADVVWEMNHPVSTQPKVELTLPVTLEELFKGATKKVLYTRPRFKANGMDLVDHTSEFLVKVERGWRWGLTILFEKDGPQGPALVPADVQIKIVAPGSPHKSFVIDGDDLVYTEYISLRQALTGLTVVLKTMDGRTLRIPIYEVIFPGYERVVKGEGMPRAGCTEAAGKIDRGDLRIKFVTRFPEKLSKSQCDTLRSCLPK